MWQRFGQGLNEVILVAVRQAEDQETERDLSTRHLLLALAACGDRPAARLLRALGVSAEAVQEALAQAGSGEEHRAKEALFGASSTLTAEARDAMEAAYSLAAKLGDEYIGGEHLLLALVREPFKSDAGRVLAQLGITWQGAGQALMAQQKWRTQPPPGITPPHLPRRRLLRRWRDKAGRVKRLAYCVSQRRTPCLAYVAFPKRTTDNPYPFYTRLRSQPVYWDALLGHWIVTRYDDVAAALAEPRFSQRVYSASAWAHADLPALVQREFRCLQNGLNRQMLFQDAPDQPKQRALVARRFTPRVIAQMQEQMQEVADALLDTVQAAGRMEVIADLAVPFPLRVITRMLGLPDTDLPRLKRWSHDYFKYLTFETSLADDLAAYRSVREADAYFRALLPARRRQPQDDLITLLLQPGSDAEFLPEDDVVANCLLLLATGHENTTRLISSGLLALLRFPEQWQALCADPALAGTAVEEMLRFDSPVQWTLRFLQEDFKWRGQLLRAGQRVQIGIGPANRDPAQFPDADKFDITRTENRHVAFGHGPHFCLGAALARLEAQVFFRSLSERFPHLHLAETPQWRQEGLAFRGLQSLHVRWDGPAEPRRSRHDTLVAAR
jgi:cytochrome P450